MNVKTIVLLTLWLVCPPTVSAQGFFNYCTMCHKAPVGTTVKKVTSKPVATTNKNIKINEKAIEKAKTYLYVREENNDNRSPDIDLWHKAFGLPFGNPYCAMFSQYAYLSSFESIGVRDPMPKMPRVATFTKWAIGNPLTVKTISGKQVALGIKVEPGDIICWRHGIGGDENFMWNGHMGLAISQSGLTINTIEGNTKPSNKGDQTGRVKGDTSAGHDGVYLRQRGLGIGSNFPILYFVRLQKRDF